MRFCRDKTSLFSFKKKKRSCKEDQDIGTGKLKNLSAIKINLQITGTYGTGTLYQYRIGCREIRNNF
jgi:hypothetical protein